MRKPARAQATMTARPSSSSHEMRIRQLENENQELKQQLHMRAVETVLDLQEGLGIAEKERNESAQRLQKIPSDALEIMKATLVKALSRLNSVASSPPESAGSSRGVESYIA